MQRLRFDLQRFATQEISAGDTYTQNGLIYTAITDAVLNLDDDGKISGLESGKVQSTLIHSEIPRQSLSTLPTTRLNFLQPKMMRLPSRSTVERFISPKAPQPSRATKFQRAQQNFRLPELIQMPIINSRSKILPNSR